MRQPIAPLSSGPAPDQGFRVAPWGNPRRLVALGLGHLGARLVSGPVSLLFALVSGPEAFTLFGPYLAGLALAQIGLFGRY